MIRKCYRYFTRLERVLWSASVAAIVTAFWMFDAQSYLTLAASLIGVTALIFNAKGNPFGQVLMVLFSILYGVISFRFSYYGEMLTYVGMTMPMSVVALVTWLKHPYEGERAQVKIKRLGKAEGLLSIFLTAVVTAVFYRILDCLHTANLLPSTVSVATSFIAVYLTMRRSPYYALAYAANDVVLIVLWIMASAEQSRYLSVTVCFAAFLVNDVYGFFSWRKMENAQRTASKTP